LEIFQIIQKEEEGKKRRRREKKILSFKNIYNIKLLK